MDFLSFTCLIDEARAQRENNNIPTLRKVFSVSVLDCLETKLEQIILQF